MEFKEPDFRLIPEIKYHKGKEEYVNFITQIAGIQEDQQEEQNLSLP